MSPTRIPDRLAREAADWFARLKARTVTVADLEAFRVWNADPEHRRAYEAVEAVWRDGESLRDDPEMARLTASLAARRRPKPGRARFAAAAGLLATCAAAVIVWVAVQPDRYATAPGERRSVRLADGSQVELDIDSAVEARLSGPERRITLTRGRALFSVAHDRSRPFLVRAGETLVTATGTRFAVRRDRDGALVTLVEGGVEVTREDRPGAAWRLSPGEELNAIDRSIPAPKQVDAAAAIAWSDGRLVFQGTPLSQAAGEVSRYGDRPLRLSAGVDPAIPISGAFDAGDTLAFAEAVGRLHGLTVRSSEAFVRLDPAPENKF